MASAWIDTCWDTGAWDEGAWLASEYVAVEVVEPFIESLTAKLFIRSTSKQLSISVSDM